MPKITQILNFIKISERIATSGQPTESQFEIIAQSGFQIVINLAMPNSDNAIVEEGFIVSTYNMVYVHIPVPFDAPTLGHLKTFIKIMKCFSDKKILIHCAVNKRASAFIYQYQRIILDKNEYESKNLSYKAGNQMKCGRDSWK